MFPTVVALVALSSINYGSATGPEDSSQNQVVEVKNWPQTPPKLGQVTAVSVNSLGQPVIFHRAEKSRESGHFNASRYYKHVDKGPIVGDPILILDVKTGVPVDSWGANIFYVPHGITVDQHDNVWTTDLARHQVFKFTPNNHKEPALTIGQAFKSGILDLEKAGKGYSVTKALCMPSSVAVASTGEFFVADGYCNNQILKFDAAGNFLTEFPTPEDNFYLLLPHGIALVEELDLVCAADRPGKKIVCRNAGLKSGINSVSAPAKVIDDPALGNLYGITSYKQTLYVVNGGHWANDSYLGFTINPVTGKILDTWHPEAGFGKPHAVAITNNGSHLYVVEKDPNLIWQFEVKK